MSFTQYEFADIWFHAGCARAVTSSSSIVCQPYSPEFMPMEGIWKTNRKFTTHNAFFVTPDQRDAKLTETCNVFQRRPEVISARVARFR